MTVNKQFAQDGTGLDDCMDELIEGLVELLEEPQDQAAAGVTSDLRSGGDRVIHVVVNKPEE